MAPERDSGENPWFTDCCNIGIQAFIMWFPLVQTVQFVTAFLCCNDCWFQQLIGMNLLPPGANAWNKVANDGILAYGNRIEPTVDYTTFYNVREGGEEPMVMNP